MRIIALFSNYRALFYSKALLLINNNQSQIVKINFFGQNSVRANKDVRAIYLGEGLLYDARQREGAHP